MHAHREAGSRKAPADPGVMGALAGAGMSHAFVYGQYPLTVPLIVVGLAWAGLMAARANWRACGTGLAVAAVGGAWIARAEDIRERRFAEVAIKARAAIQRAAEIRGGAL